MDCVRGGNAADGSGLRFERTIATGLVAWLAIGAAIIVQYLGRKRERTAMVLVAGGLLTLGVGTAAYRSRDAGDPPRAREREWNVTAAAGIRLEWVDATLERPGTRPAGRGGFGGTPKPAPGPGACLPWRHRQELPGPEGKI